MKFHKVIVFCIGIVAIITLPITTIIVVIGIIAQWIYELGEAIIKMFQGKFYED